MEKTLYKIKTLDGYRNQFEFCGALTEILYEKKIFKKNSDIAQIIFEIYNISFKPYVLKSRTLLVGKLLKEIISSKYNKEDARKLKKLILLLIDYQEEKKTTKRQKSTSNLNEIQALIRSILQ